MANAEQVQYVHGIRANLGQFSHQLLQVFFVGLTIGMHRNVIPALAEEEFGVPAGSFTLLMAFIVSFGFVKGTLNFVAGRLSDRIGRRKILLAGWLAALTLLLRGLQFSSPLTGRARPSVVGRAAVAGAGRTLSPGAVACRRLRQGSRLRREASTRNPRDRILRWS